MAGADRVVVAAERLFTLLHLADEVPAVDGHGEAGHGAARGQRERVDGLDGALLVVPVALAHDRAGMPGHHLGAHLDPEEGYGVAVRVQAGLLCIPLRMVRLAHRFRPPSFTFDIASKIVSISLTSFTDLSGASSATVRSTPGNSSMRRNTREA